MSAETNTPVRAALPNHTCPLCGGPNDCAAAASGRLGTGCWCNGKVDREMLARMPAPVRRDACLCPRCASGGAPREAGVE